MLERLDLVYDISKGEKIRVSPHELGEALQNYLDYTFPRIMLKKGHLTERQVKDYEFKIEHRKDGIWGIGEGANDVWVEICSHGDKLYTLVNAAEILCSLRPRVRFPWLEFPSISKDS